VTPSPEATIDHPSDEARSALAYRGSVADSFGLLKGLDRLDAVMAAGIPLADGRGWLVPIGRLHADDPALVGLLARWRRENEHAFPSRFTVTEEGTARWLSAQVLDRPDRMLFMVTDRHGAPIGHAGLANAINDERSIEVDNIVRGVPDVEPGIMASAVLALIGWAEETLWPDTIELRVLASNVRAIRFYRGLGFVERDRVPMVWEGTADSRTLVESATVAPDAFDDELVAMVYAPAPRTSFDAMILTSGPSISAAEVTYTLDAARSGWMRNWSGYIDRFEAAFAEYIGVAHAISTSSCTGALHIAMLALGIGPGDEVIVPDMTWVATAKAVQYVGATPVFADIQPDTMCMAPASFEGLITPRTKAVVPVHLYGHPAEMDQIVRIARAAGLYIVEDAAPAIGAEVGGRRAGTFGDFAAFSFQGAKLLSTGEGGALVTNDPVLYERALKIWDQGRNPDRAFWIDGDGLKYKMSNVQAALGLGQIERADAHVEAKRRLHSWYREALAGIPGISLFEEAGWARSIHWMNSVRTEDETGAERDALRTWLRDRNVDSRIVFPAISDYPIWSSPSAGGPAAHNIAARGLNLPSGLWMRRDHVEYVAGCVRGFAEHRERRPS